MRWLLWGRRNASRRESPDAFTPVVTAAEQAPQPPPQAPPSPRRPKRSAVAPRDRHDRSASASTRTPPMAFGASTRDSLPSLTEHAPPRTRGSVLLPFRLWRTPSSQRAQTGRSNSQARTGNLRWRSTASDLSYSSNAAPRVSSLLPSKASVHPHPAELRGRSIESQSYSSVQYSSVASARGGSASSIPGMKAPRSRSIQLLQDTRERPRIFTQPVISMSEIFDTVSAQLEKEEDETAAPSSEGRTAAPSSEGRGLPSCLSRQDFGSSRRSKHEGAKGSDWIANSSSMPPLHRSEGTRNLEANGNMKNSFTEPSPNQSEPSRHKEERRRIGRPMTKAEIHAWKARNGRKSDLKPSEKGVDRSAGPAPTRSKRPEVVGPDVPSEGLFWSNEKNVGTPFGTNSDSERPQEEARGVGQRAAGNA